MAGPDASASGSLTPGTAPAGSGEDSLIARHFRPLATDPGAFGLTDDAAVLQAHGEDVVVNADAIVEGVHFLPDDPSDSIARKALRVNLSDLAAKGAIPAGFVLTLALREARHDWLAEFARGLGEDIATFGCPLLGGDTVSTPGPLMISVTAFGRVAPGRMVRRAGAQVGDHLVVTGTLGDAATGLKVLQHSVDTTVLAGDPAMVAHLVSRYRVPQPRSALALAVRNYASAAMDVSDGLAGDLAKLCNVSGVSATINVPSLPLSAAVQLLYRHGAIGIETAIAGGDDYEIVCAVSDSKLNGFMREADLAGVAATVIGTITSGHIAPQFIDAQGQPLKLARRSFSHF